MTDLNLELKGLIIEALGLEDVTVDDAVDHAELARLSGAEDTAGEQQLEGTMASDDARQMRIMDRGDDADVDLGIAERRALGC